MTADRVMAVLEPLKVVLTNVEDKEVLEVENNPNAETITHRQVTFGKNIYIDRSDFALVPPPKYFRLKPDGYVRLKGAYIIHCDEVVYNDSGDVDYLKCSIVPDSKSGSDTSGMKVKGVIQWVDADNCVDLEVRQLESLLTDVVDGVADFTERFNNNSMVIVKGKGEKCLADSTEGKTYQFMRIGYYVYDKDSTDDVKVFNRVVGLKDGFKAK